MACIDRRLTRCWRSLRCAGVQYRAALSLTSWFYDVTTADWVCASILRRSTKSCIVPLLVGRDRRRSGPMRHVGNEMDSTFIWSNDCDSETLLAYLRAMASCSQRGNCTDSSNRSRARCMLIVVNLIVGPRTFVTSNSLSVITAQ